MGVLKNRIAVWFVVLLFAIASAVVAFQMASNSGSPDRVFSGNLLTDPNPDKGKDCPPQGGYGAGNSGKTAKGREKHCTQPTGKGAK